MILFLRHYHNFHFNIGKTNTMNDYEIEIDYFDEINYVQYRNIVDVKVK